MNAPEPSFRVRKAKNFRPNVAEMMATKAAVLEGQKEQKQRSRSPKGKDHESKQKNQKLL